LSGRIHRRSARWAALAAAAALVGGGALVAATLPASAATTATVSVNANQALGSVPSTGVGTNVSVYDGNMNDSSIAGLLKNGGFGVERYPGGSYADIYHWQTNTTDGGYVAPNTNFDTYMATMRAAGTQPMVIVDYGAGTPQEAAAWVQYANVTKGYGVKYWEVGNEIYGNGEYGSKWENDTHSSHSATTYANNLVQFVNAMKAVDPSIKVGAVLTTPGNWPDGLVGPGDTMDWNHTVLSIAASKIDFGIVHWYPGGTSEADMLTKPQAQLPGITSGVRTLINQYAGSRAASIGIAMTEANGDKYRDSMPAALFAPDAYLTFMEHGGFNLDWWALHNGTDCSQVTTVDGAKDYNDYGVLSSGASCEPALDTPFPPYYGTAMVSELAGSGDTLVSASSSTSLLSAHAVKKANGDVSVMLINKDPNNDATVNLSYSGYTAPAGAPTVVRYLKNATSITSTTAGSANSQTVPAYSIVVVQLHGGTGSTGSPTPSPSNTSPSPSPSVSPSRTTSPTPSGTGGCRVSYGKNEWQGGLVANLTITNTGNTTVNGWTLTFTFPGDTRVTNTWSATLTQNGSAVTARSVSYNTTINPGGNVTFGFQGTWTGNDANPTSFALNGANCTTG
jgi:Cellulose binding domain